jgi:hypothetical protein
MNVKLSLYKSRRHMGDGGIAPIILSLGINVREQFHDPVF